MNDSPPTVSLRLAVALEPAAAFERFVAELTTALAHRGLVFESGPAGRVLAGASEVARVDAWKADEGFRLRWHPAAWAPTETGVLALHLERSPGGSTLVLSYDGPGDLIGDAHEVTGWFAGVLAGPFLAALTPAGLGDWLTDRQARRPTGMQAQAIYRDPVYHYPNFRVILAELALTSDDVLLEVGCGGGALLKEALRSGCRAAAIDHSADMVRLARDENRDAVAAGRLEVRRSSAERLPFADASFTCATMTGVLGFLPDPVAALREIHRTLVPRGRLVMLGSDPALKGTLAAPEPMASRLHFYTELELAQLGRRAGFARVKVVRRSLEAHAREAGVPEEHLHLFAGPGEPFLLAHKD